MGAHIRTSLCAALLAVCAFISTDTTHVASAAPAPTPHTKRTVIEITVRGCPHCRIGLQQVKDLSSSDPDGYWSGPIKRVRGGAITFSPPTRRTNQMFFTVYAPFDEWARGGVPMVIALGFKDKRAGAPVSPAFVSRSHRASGCWGGTTGRYVHRTLVVTRHRRYEPISQQRLTMAAGYFTRTLPARPFWIRTRDADLHATEPTICK